ncbi:unnamed protein product [Caenorhabditis auriculariae]|uniref:Ig-like domain-containing protein n=1 Tax=Caenorhabditis auriculariae TaxID=2777116 RepID=A0A8S1HN52_9PELO|nr:unnamed protein product [Caenorhabditis auriculariae]
MEEPVQILDAENPNFEKQAGNIKNPETRKKSVHLAKLRQWLKYDADCAFLTSIELQIKIDQGRCAPLRSTTVKTTTTKKQSFLRSLFKTRKRKKIVKKEGFFSHDRKEKVFRSVVGDNNIRYINVEAFDEEIDVIDGSMITLTCDLNSRKWDRTEGSTEEVVWYVNNNEMQMRWFDWRVTMSEDGKLGLWPIRMDDSGHFECYVNGRLQAAVNINVITMTSALLGGFYNYCIVCAIFGICTLILGICMGDLAQAPKRSVEVDRMTEFLTKHVFNTNQAAKEKGIVLLEKFRWIYREFPVAFGMARRVAVARKIGKLIEGKYVFNPVDERELINKRNDNRSTIMLLLQQDEMKNRRKNKTKAAKKSSEERSKGPMTSKESGTDQMTSSNVEKTLQTFQSETSKATMTSSADTSQKNAPMTSSSGPMTGPFRNSPTPKKKEKKVTSFEEKKKLTSPEEKKKMTSSKEKKKKVTSSEENKKKMTSSEEKNEKMTSSGNQPKVVKKKK